MKKIAGILLTFGAAVLMAGCGSRASVSGKEPTTIRVAFNQSEQHPEYIAMKEFGEKLKEETNGAYEVQIYPNAILGDQGPVTEFVRTGALQMAMVPVSVPEGYNSDFAIVSAPYLYDTMGQGEVIRPFSRKSLKAVKTASGSMWTLSIMRYRRISVIQGIW